MHWIDWLVMLAVLGGIIAYGMWKTRSVQSVQSYLMGDHELNWWTIGLSVMATQASAITFLSTPGQAYDDGMRFMQFYLGMPIAMVLLVIFVLPIYYRLNVYTPYEYLEGRFDLKTRTLTAILFLFSRGMAAGFTIAAPSIVLASIMDWNLAWTIILMGGVVTVYTVFGGTKAVSVTQEHQMAVILIGLVVTAVLIVQNFPEDVSLMDAVGVADHVGKMNTIDTKWDLSNRYNIWSGLIASVFLFLSYFGTDQSQVQRYLSGKTLRESSLGLLFNGFIKVPMQAFVLFTGILVFMFYQFTQPPIHFNKAPLLEMETSPSAAAYLPKLDSLKGVYSTIFEEKKSAVISLVDALHAEDEARAAAATEQVKEWTQKDKEVRAEVSKLIEAHAKDEGREVETNDRDYIFITFVVNHLPKGMIGLLLAVILCAAMSSTSSELNALATASVVDIYRRSLVTARSDEHYLSASKWLTLAWGALVILFASFTLLFENLIQAVNIVGSLLYGTILGIFVVAFFFKKVGGTAVFLAAMVGEAAVVTIYFVDKMDGKEDLGFLWLNPVGCAVVMVSALILQATIGGKVKES